MHPVLEKIFKTKTFINERGETIQVNSETPRGQCEFIQKIIRENNFESTLEIGLAFGISTIAILEMVVNKGGKHCVIDKFQTTDWGGNGLSLIRQSGFSEHIEFYEDYVIAER